MGTARSLRRKIDLQKVAQVLRLNPPPSARHKPRRPIAAHPPLVRASTDRWPTPSYARRRELKELRRMETMQRIEAIGARIMDYRFLNDLDRLAYRAAHGFR